MFVALREMIRAFIGTVNHFVEKFVTIVLVLGVCFVGWLFQTWRSDMWSGPAGKVAGLAFLWLLIWFLTSVLILRPSLKLASALVMVVGLMILLNTFNYFAPGTVQAGKTLVTYRDQKNLRVAQRAVVEVLKPFDCNRTNSETNEYYGWNGTTGHAVPLIWTARDPDSGRIVCFRESGVYAKTGQLVNAITEDVRQKISRQEPLAPLAKPTSAPQQITHIVRFEYPSPSPPLSDKPPVEHGCETRGHSAEGCSSP